MTFVKGLYFVKRLLIVTTPRANPHKSSIPAPVRCASSSNRGIPSPVTTCARFLPEKATAFEDQRSEASPSERIPARTMSDISISPGRADIDIATGGITKTLDAPTAAPIEQKAEKTKRVSKRLTDAIRLLASGECKTQKAAAERVGMNYTHFCEALRKPHVRVFIERECRESIASGTLIRARARLHELLDAGSEHVSLDATKHVLAIAGIKPSPDAQVSVNVDIKAGFVIDLSEPRVPTRINEIKELDGNSVHET